MAIIYSYPETLELLPADMLIGTSTIRVAGKKKNITKNFTLELLKNFILDGNVGVQWGTITGTLSNQTDLQAALNAKQNNITLTTVGSAGPATLVGATLNVPNYAGVSYTFTSPLVNTEGAVTINQSSSTVNGYLSSTDWNTFNNKQSTITLTTTGTGVATLIANVLNIPTPAAATFTSLTTTGSTGPATLISGTLNVPDYSTGMAIPTLNQVLTAGNTSLLDLKAGNLYSYDNLNVGYGIVQFYDGGVSLKAATTNNILFYNDATGTVKFSNGTYLPTLNFAGVGNNIYTFQNANGTLAFTSDIPSLAGYVPTSRTISTTSPLQGGGDLTVNRTLSILQSGSSQDGYLSSTDWNTFNGKQNTISLTTTGSSGSATLVGNTLNVPTYTLAGLGGISLTSLSSTATGLTYTNTTGVFSLTSGYLIPTTASYNNTNWDTAYTNRITSLTTTGTGAATLIANVLNIPTPAAAAFTSLTTTGSSGASTLIVGVLNVPTYTLSGLGGVPTSRTLTINGTTYDLTTDRSWTITASGKSINVVSTNTSAGSASSTDYVYLASGTINITLPTAVGNQNLYTIKNVGTGTITIDTISSQTIDGSLTAPIKVQYLSLTIISDGANWNII